MIKRGTDDLKQLATTQSSLVLHLDAAVDRSLPRILHSSSTVIVCCSCYLSPTIQPPYRTHRATSNSLSRCIPKHSETKRRASAGCCTRCQTDYRRTQCRSGGMSSGRMSLSGSPRSPRLDQTQLQIRYVCHSVRSLENVFEG